MKTGTEDKDRVETLNNEIISMKRSRAGFIAFALAFPFATFFIQDYFFVTDPKLGIPTAKAEETSKKIITKRLREAFEKQMPQMVEQIPDNSSITQDALNVSIDLKSVYTDKASLSRDVVEEIVREDQDKRNSGTFISILGAFMILTFTRGSLESDIRRAERDLESAKKELERAPQYT